MVSKLAIPPDAMRVGCSLELVGTRPADDKSDRRPFKGRANSGDVIEDHWFWGNFAVDMAGMVVGRQDLPVLLSHDPDAVVGYTTKIEAGDEGVNVEGQLLSVTEAGRQVIALLESGMPLQMSVYIPPPKDGVEEVAEGAEATVNGRTLSGPGHVFRKSRLREVTITPLGADEQTGAALLAQGRTVEVELSRRETMTDKKTETAPPTAAALTAQHPEIVAEIAASARAEAMTAERERIAFINQKAAKGGISVELVNQAIAEGWGKEKTLTTFYDYQTERKEARLAEIRDEHSEAKLSVGSDDATFSEGERKPRKSPPKNTEEAWKAEFAESDELREEFQGDEAVYLAYQRHKHQVRMNPKEQV